jgi:uncharacterized RDD family membrane protein YckC
MKLPLSTHSSPSSTSNKDYLNKPILVARKARILAKLIDFLPMVIGCTIFYPIGVIFSLIYLCIKDSLQQGQSLGKRIMGFRVISLDDGTPCSLKQSFIRNLPFSIPLFLALIPFIGQILSLIFIVPAILLELYYVWKIHSGHRLGDILADTTLMAHDGDRISLTIRKKIDLLTSTRALKKPQVYTTKTSV